MGTHIASQITSPQLQTDNTLHVVSVVSNPVRWHSRYRLAREHAERMKATPNVAFHFVECCFGDRAPELNADLTLRTRSEAWTKESMINLGVRYLLPRHWKYVAWVDADVEFRDPNWAQETLHQLQHFAVVQPWQQCSDLGATGNVMQLFQSFGLLHQRGVRKQKYSAEPYPYGHSGFAWAATRAFWERVEGMIDFAVLGSADHHMAWAMVGDVDASVHQKMHPAYLRRCREWQARAKAACGGEIGFCQGRIEHHFHGPKARRYYRERWQILVDAKYNPDTDLTYDEQGLVQLTRKDLEQAIRKYNRSRAEDSIEET
jgi:hypothetical protein